MFRLNRAVALAFLLTLGLAPATRAGIITPVGLAPGDQFRMVFVTDGTYAATSTDITTYDAIVAAEAAAAGLDTYNGTSVTWQVLASTASVSANSRLPPDTSIPIFLFDGTEVAFSGDALWSTGGGGMDPLMHPINLTPTNQVIGDNWLDNLVWTGTRVNGTTGEYYSLGYYQPYWGFATATDYRWINWSIAGYTFYGDFRLYAFSDVIVAAEPLAVPEPATLTLLGMGFVTIGAYGLRKRQRMPTESIPACR